MSYRNCFIFILFLLSSCMQDRTYAQGKFINSTREAGIHHQFIPYEGTFGGGACVFDFNNDGWEDVFITGGMADDALYLNKKNGAFENVFEKSGLKTKPKYVTQGAVSADINRDGWRDLFITTITTIDNTSEVPRAMNLLFLNKGNGTFKDVTKEFRLDTLLTFSTGAMFGDVNLDGYPDLYVGNYFQQFEGKLHLMNDNIIVSSKQFAKGLLLINHGGKYFKNEYADYGLDYKGFGFGGAFTDFDKDGDLDIIVNHDFGYKAPPNRFLENKYPRKKFVDISDTMKMRLPINAMGTAIGDYNNDGWMDYYITNIRANPFMVNQGDGKPFVNRNKELGIRLDMIDTKQGYVLPVSWGCNFADFDHDNDVDLFVANGCLNPFVMPNPDYYFENRLDSFVNIADSVGLNDEGIGRGSVVFDYDHDGDLDILVVNQKPASDGMPDASPTFLYRNELVKKGNWIQVALKGVESDMSGIGARVEVVIAKLRMIREIDGGSSHESQNSVIAQFGIGLANSVDEINVYWPGGNKQTVFNQRANQVISITEIPVTGSWNRIYRYPVIALVVVLLIAGIVILKQRKFFKTMSIRPGLFFVLAWLAVLSSCSEANKKEETTKVPVAIIFDTDIGPDYDDVGAISVLHALADSGECKILATMGSNQHKRIASVLDVLNSYFNRPDIPIGVVRGIAVNMEAPQKWDSLIVARYPHDIKSNDQADDALKLYRKILAAQPDSSVTIVTVGFLTNMANLLQSGADEYSTMTGKELIQNKVKQLVCMAGMFDTTKAGFKEFNVVKDSTASKIAFDGWPTPIVFSGFEVGVKILTGLPVVHNDSITNSPVKDVFAKSIPLDPNDKNGRMSWDETAVLTAIRGPEKYFGIVKGQVICNADGSNSWNPQGTRDVYLTIKMPIPEIEQVLNDLIMHQPVSEKE